MLALGKRHFGKLIFLGAFNLNLVGKLLIFVDFGVQWIVETYKFKYFFCIIYMTLRKILTPLSLEYQGLREYLQTPKYRNCHLQAVETLGLPFFFCSSDKVMWAEKE